MTQHLLTVATRAGNLAATLQDSIDQIANRQRIARILDDHWKRSALGLSELPPAWVALTDAELEAAAGVQDAVRRLMNRRPAPVVVDEPIRMVPTLRVVR